MPEEIVRNCHSDIKLNMSVHTISQLLYMLSLSVKFARLVVGENSTEYKTAVHWYDECLSCRKHFDKTFSYDKPEPIEFIIHSFFE